MCTLISKSPGLNKFSCWLVACRMLLTWRPLLNKNSCRWLHVCVHLFYKLPGLNKFSCWLVALPDVAHLETLVKQEHLQVTVHVCVHLFPSYLAWSSSPVDRRLCRMLLIWRLLLNKNSCRWLCTYVYTYFQVTWIEQVSLLTCGTVGAFPQGHLRPM